jgi:hypothetical protein
MDPAASDGPVTDPYWNVTLVPMNVTLVPMKVTRVPMKVTLVPNDGIRVSVM